jgi:carbohydrate-selective porin OprB
VFITPDLRYIVAPLGNSDNDDIVTAMLRLQLVF